MKVTANGSMGYRIEIEVRDHDDMIVETYKTLEPLMRYVKQTLRRIIGFVDIHHYDVTYWVLDVATGKYIDVEI